MLFDHNVYTHNKSYGLDPHDDSDYLTITNNTFAENGNHGLICSQRCDHLTIRGNTSRHNRCRCTGCIRQACRPDDRKPLSSRRHFSFLVGRVLHREWCGRDGLRSHCRPPRRRRRSCLATRGPDRRWSARPFAPPDLWPWCAALQHDQLMACGHRMALFLIEFPTLSNTTMPPPVDLFSTVLFSTIASVTPRWSMMPWV